MPEIGMRVYDPRGGLKTFRLREDFYHNFMTDRKSVQHIYIAAVET
jgi:hypothetical protein